MERQVRQMLADKISGNQVGIWLLIPEHLRLGTWDLLLNWTGGISPYQVQVTTNLPDAGWQNLGTPVSITSLLVSPTNDAAFYRIYGR